MSVVCSKQNRIIAASDYVIVTLPSGASKIVELRENGTIHLGKFGSFLVKGVLGYSYGQSFEILEEKSVIPIKSILFESDDQPSDNIEDESKEATPEVEIGSSETNKHLNDLGAEIQSLTPQEIEKMKKEGNGNSIGKAIIDKMIQSHSAFDKKTVFSQEKYLKRKQQKFTRRFTINYMSSSQMLKYYYEKDSGRILNLSEETLGLMMSYGNVIPGGNYLVIDETGGLIIYAMLERMQGEGTITVLHENDQPNHIILRNCGYSEEQIDSMVLPVNWLQFTEPDTEYREVIEIPEERIETLAPKKKEQYHRRIRRNKQVNRSLDMIKEGGFDGFICVSTLNPCTLVPKVLDKLAGSRSVVVYNQYKEVLVETYHALSKDLRVLAPNIYESYVRKYQTIPGRIHPLMTSRNLGGYIYWGTRVIPREGVIAVGRGLKNKRPKPEEKEEGDDKKDSKKQKTESQDSEVKVEA
ncbi:hypothetical protein B5S31_g3933 [[Candida] boidinii]|nr:hypothetical protein B5S31_g3933 [[Candida] boidinii]